MDIVGIRRGITKKNKDFTVLHGVTDFDDYEMDGAEGNKVVTIYVGKALDVNLGDTVDIIYGVGFEGKAVVKDVLVK